jgi:hypothetical protein
MERTVKVFVIPKERVPGGPPRPARELTVQAATVDGLREAARSKLADEGLRVRSLSFGPKGLVAYVEERA